MNFTPFLLRPFQKEGSGSYPTRDVKAETRTAGSLALKLLALKLTGGRGAVKVRMESLRDEVEAKKGSFL